jgi:hypothetical protein
MPDTQDYECLAALLAHPESWSDEQAAEAQLLRKRQADNAASYDQRDQRRVASMWGLVKNLDKAIATWQATRRT